MKAVIMAGGEGTRLRPLTSNAPKPMLPLVNRPMMEHIIDLLRRHGIDDIVVTVAFMANAIRTYFGDGSEFGVNIDLRHRGDPARHRRLGAQRHGPARRAVPGHLRRRAHRHRPRSDRRLPRAATARWPPSAWRTSTNPLEFGIVITREDGSHRAVPREADLGPGVQRHHQHRHLRARAARSSTTSTPIEPSTSRARSSPSCSADGSRSTGPSPRATGRTWARSRPTCGPTRTSSTARSRSTSRASSSSDGVWLGEGAEIHPEAEIVGPAVIGDNCRVEARARIGEYTVLGANVRVRSDADLERTVVHDNAYLGEGVRLRGTVVGRACDLRKRRAGRGGRRRRRRVLHRRGRAPVGRASRSTRSRRSRRVPSSTTRSCGSREAPGRCSAATASPAWPTSTSPPSSPPGWRWPTARCSRRAPRVITSRDSSRSARMLKRAMMAGLNAAGVDVDDLEVASVPVTRFIVRRPSTTGGITIRLVNDDPQSVVIRFFDDRRPRHHRGRAAQDRAPVQPRGLPPGAPRRDRRHRLRPPGSRALRVGPRVHGRHRARSARRSSRSSSTTPTARPPSPCPTCWPSSASRCWRSTRSCPPPG